jgi:hypothetical protein
MAKRGGELVSGKRIMPAVTVAFLGIGVGAALLILAWAPTVTPYRLLGFLTFMFVLAGSVVVAAILWALRRPRPRELVPGLHFLSSGCEHHTKRRGYWQDGLHNGPLDRTEGIRSPEGELPYQTGGCAVSEWKSTV